MAAEPTKEVEELMEKELCIDEPTTGSDGDQASRKPLGDRMKEMENANLQTIDPSLPWMVRLDGHKFSSFTANFKRPFDDRVHHCMIAACNALLKEFKPTTVYTCSDEITLIFPSFESEQRRQAEERASKKKTKDAGDKKAVDEKQADEEKNGEANKQENNFRYGGRVQKMATLMASLAGVAFDRELRRQGIDVETEPALSRCVERSMPHFDARIFSVKTEHDIVSNLIWRSQYDYRRNSISQYARQFYSPSQMHKVNSAQLVERMLTEHGFDWNAQPGRYKFGSVLKRQRFYKLCTYNGVEVNASRSRTVELSFQIAHNGPDIQAFFLSPMLPEDFNENIVAYHEDPEKAK